MKRTYTIDFTTLKKIDEDEASIENDSLSIVKDEVLSPIFKEFKANETRLLSEIKSLTGCFPLTEFRYEFIQAQYILMRSRELKLPSFESITTPPLINNEQFVYDNMAIAFGARILGNFLVSHPSTLAEGCREYEKANLYFKQTFLYYIQAFRQQRLRDASALQNFPFLKWMTVLLKLAENATTKNLSNILNQLNEIIEQFKGREAQKIPEVFYARAYLFERQKNYQQMAEDLFIVAKNMGKKPLEWRLELAEISALEEKLNLQIRTNSIPKDRSQLKFPFIANEKIFTESKSLINLCQIMQQEYQNKLAVDFTFFMRLLSAGQLDKVTNFLNVAKQKDTFFKRIDRQMTRCLNNQRATEEKLALEATLLLHKEKEKAHQEKADEKKRLQEKKKKDKKTQSNLLRKERRKKKQEEAKTTIDAETITLTVTPTSSTTEEKTEKVARTITGAFPFTSFFNDSIPKESADTLLLLIKTVTAAGASLSLKGSYLLHWMIKQLHPDTTTLFKPNDIDLAINCKTMSQFEEIKKVVANAPFNFVTTYVAPGICENLSSSLNAKNSALIFELTVESPAYKKNINPIPLTDCRVIFSATGEGEITGLTPEVMDDLKNKRYTMKLPVSSASASSSSSSSSIVSPRKENTDLPVTCLLMRSLKCYHMLCMDSDFKPCESVLLRFTSTWMQNYFSSLNQRSARAEMFKLLEWIQKTIVIHLTPDNKNAFFFNDELNGLYRTVYSYIANLTVANKPDAIAIKNMTEKLLLELFYQTEPCSYFQDTKIADSFIREWLREETLQQVDVSTYSYSHHASPSGMQHFLLSPLYHGSPCEFSDNRTPDSPLFSLHTSPKLNRTSFFAPSTSSNSRPPLLKTGTTLTFTKSPHEEK